MEYLPFRLQLLSRSERSFEVVAWTPAGEGRGSFELTLSDEESANIAGLIRSSWLSTTGPNAGRWRSPEEVGEWLFGLVFSERIIALYQRSVDLIGAEPELGLRLEISYDPQDSHLNRLQSLPWELLRRPGSPGFLALSRRQPVVRYSAIPHPAQHLAAPVTLRVVVVASSPRDRPALDLGRELKTLESALGSSTEIELVYPSVPTLEAVRAVFLERPCHVLHFMGHGGNFQGKEGVVVFERDDGSSQLIRGEDLANKLADFPSLQLVCLNSCQSASRGDKSGADPLTSVALSMVYAGIPAVLAMQYRISDSAAICLSRAFYRSLATGEPIEAALAEGRQGMHSASPDQAEWAIPVLFLRGAAVKDSGRLTRFGEAHQPGSQASSARIPQSARGRWAEWAVKLAAASLLLGGGLYALGTFTMRARELLIRVPALRYPREELVQLGTEVLLDLPGDALAALGAPEASLSVLAWLAVFVIAGIAYGSARCGFRQLLASRVVLGIAACGLLVGLRLYDAAIFPRFGEELQSSSGRLCRDTLSEPAPWTESIAFETCSWIANPGERNAARRQGLAGLLGWGLAVLVSCLFAARKFETTPNGRRVWFAVFASLGLGFVRLLPAAHAVARWGHEYPAIGVDGVSKLASSVDRGVCCVFDISAGAIDRSLLLRGSGCPDGVGHQVIAADQLRAGLRVLGNRVIGQGCN
jgi:hypothetical protein